MGLMGIAGWVGGALNDSLIISVWIRVRWDSLMMLLFPQEYTEGPESYHLFTRTTLHSYI